MSNRNKEPKKLVGKIRQTDLSDNVMQACFPDVKPTGTIGCTPYETVEISVTDGYTANIVAYVCLQDVSPDVYNMHIYVLKEHRTASVFKTMIKYFKPTFSKYIKDRGRTTLITGCDYDDSKMRKLVTMFGFDLKPYVVGSMNF